MGGGGGGQAATDIFINKLDRENANFFRTVEQAQEVLDAAVIPMQIPIGEQREFRGIISLRRQRAWLLSAKRDGSFEEGEIPEELRGLEEEWRERLIDKIAATNDDLIEKYLEGGADALTADELRLGLRTGIANGTIVPVFCGSGSQLAGVAQLLDGIIDSIPSAARKQTAATDLLSNKSITLKPASPEPLSALVFKTLNEQHGKISFLRVYSGELHANSSAYNPRTRKDERIGQIYMLRGKEQTSVAHARARRYRRGDAPARDADQRHALLARPAAPARPDRLPRAAVHRHDQAQDPRRPR